MFLDWYLLSRIGPEGLTPVERYLTHFGDSLSREEREQMEHLTTTIRSVFSLTDVKGEMLDLEDLVRGGMWLVKSTMPTVGLSKGDVLGARLVFFDGQPTVGRGIVLHPPEAHEAVYDIIARAKAENYPPGDLVDHLDKMRLKLDRYSNVRIQHVYQYPGDAAF